MENRRLFTIWVLAIFSSVLLLVIAANSVLTRFSQERIGREPSCQLCHEIRERWKQEDQHAPFVTSSMGFQLPCDSGYYSGLYPLNCAANYGDVQVVRALLEMGADPNQIDGRGHTAMMDLMGNITTSTASDYKACLELLVSYGADLDLKSTELGWTALHYAAFFEHPEPIRWLIDHGAEVNARDKVQRTPLHLAAAIPWKDSSLEGMLLLVEKGADCTARDDEGKMPLDLTEVAERRRSLNLACQPK